MTLPYSVVVCIKLGHRKDLHLSRIDPPYPTSVQRTALTFHPAL